MAEFSLTAYLVTSSTGISAAFGSGDASIKAEVLAQNTAAARDNFHNGAERLAGGMDTILAKAELDTYTYDTAIAAEMLFATYGEIPKAKPRAVILGYTEDCLAALTQMGLPSLHDAMNTLAWGEEVRIPVPMHVWDAVTGQFYLDPQAVQAAATELAAIGPFDRAINAAEAAQPDAFDECDPDDLSWTLEFFKANLTEAVAAGAGLAIFRHGGV